MEVYAKSVFDHFLKPILAIFWEPFSLKKSHWWNWRHDNHYHSEEISYFLKWIEGDCDAKNRSNFWSNLIQTNFGWKKSAIIEPSDFCDFYYLGFLKVNKKGEISPQICTLPLKGKSALLKGPNGVYFYAVSCLDFKPIEINVIKECKKNDIPKEIVLI